MKKYLSIIIAGALITGFVQLPETSSSGIVVQAATSIITSQPVSATVLANSTAYFSVNAKGSGLTYQWQYKTVANNSTWCNSTIGVTNKPVLEISATTQRNGYMYRCMIKDGGNVYCSDAAKLTVAGSSSSFVLSNPVDATVTEGNNAYFSVNASGTNLSYQWQYKTVANNDTWHNSTIGITNTPVLEIKGTAQRNGYMYRCLITKSNGTKTYSSAAKLTVVNPVTFLEQPSNVSITEGERAYFSVEVENSNAFSYQWQYKTTAASASWMDSSKGNPTTPTLKVDGTTDRNGYKYRCKIIDKNGKITYSNVATLTVDAAISIISQPQNAEVNDQKYTRFSVKASGQNLHYKWQFKPAGGSNWQNCTMGNYNTATLTVQGSSQRNGHSYRCIITDDSNHQVITNAVKLTVHYISLTSDISNYTPALENKEVSLNVKASGDSLQYQWMYCDGKGDYKKFDESKFGCSGTEPGIKFTMKEDYDSYFFMCRIEDKYGNVIESNTTWLENYNFGFQTQPLCYRPTDDVVKFSATPVKNPKCKYRYQWQESSDNGATWTNCTNAYSTGTTFAFVRLGGEEYKFYRMMLIDDNTGFVEYSNSVNIISDLKIIKNPEPYVYTDKIHGEVTMSVKAEGVNVQYEWEYSYNGGKTWMQASGKGRNSDTMTVEVGPNESGNVYRCKVYDVNNTLYSTNCHAVCTARYN